MKRGWNPVGRWRVLHALANVVVILSAFALTWVLPLAGQSPNGVLNGLVVDPSNRAIVDAEVLAINDVTGAQYGARTNGEGIYVLPNLPPGPYHVLVFSAGLSPAHLDLTLSRGQAVELSLVLDHLFPLGREFGT